jgi:hypothetical protein
MGDEMQRAILAACLILAASDASAAWKTEQGRKIMSTFPPPVGMIATLPAKAPHNGVTAQLRLECFTHPELTGIQFGIVLSKKPPNGFMAWKYQYDDKPAVQTKPYSRSLPPEVITLGDATSAEIQGLVGAKVLKLTLLPAEGTQLPYEFDVAGAADAIKTVGCKEFRK